MKIENLNKAVNLSESIYFVKDEIENLEKSKEVILKESVVLDKIMISASAFSIKEDGEKNLLGLVSYKVPSNQKKWLLEIIEVVLEFRKEELSELEKEIEKL